MAQSRGVLMGYPPQLPSHQTYSQTPTKHSSPCPSPSLCPILTPSPEARPQRFTEGLSTFSSGENPGAGAALEAERERKVHRLSFPLLSASRRAWGACHGLPA